ncbi:MAG TPA: helicase C-terminal domain-containing protein [Longimicrobiales bacterium]|nr:helicase C-terminal domain-containing protein [Longimicrobiales bacterium]
MSPAPLDPGQALVGLDGLESSEVRPPRPAPGSRPLVLAPEAAARIREEIERARGREVCFLAEVTPERSVVRPRAVARGNRAAVLAVARDAPEGAVLIHNHPSGLLEPSDADLAVAAQVFDAGLGTAITDNGATELYVVVEPPAPRVRVPLDPGELETLVGPSGGLARAHPGYEDRPGQREMIRVVSERYNQGGVALVEAGTGTGKSLAYLIPAARWALENRERTVISTNTINLQEQLVTKDLPLVAELVGQELTWALVKGRGNYVSIRRALLAGRGAPDLFEEDRSQELSSLLSWIQETDDGSLTDLTFTPSDEVWEEVKSDPDACLRARCPHFQACFYQRSRRRASSARLLVVNHHLLFTDVAVRRATRNWTQSAVLPAYRHVILDEAHNVEDAATSHLGVQASRRGLFRLLARLDRRGKGLLTALADSLAAEEGRAVEHRTRIEEKVRPAVEDARANLSLFLDHLEPVLDGARPGEAVRIGSGEDTIPEPAEDDAVRERLHGLLGALQRLAREIAELRRRVEGDEGLAEEVEGRLLDLRGSERRLGAAEVALRLVLEPGDQEERLVRWLELRGRGRRRNLTLAAAPIELGEVLRDALFSRAETTVLTSATLTTRRRFDFLRGRLGLDPGGLAEMERPPEVVERQVPSPFAFDRQSLLVVPTDLPDAQADPAGLDLATVRVVAELAAHTDGGLFVLFTSHRALRQVADGLRAGGVGERWPLFVQGESDRHALLGGFTGDGRGILLGTSSFWEGVDVPGDPLRGLVIQRLPFRVPTEPVTAARVEALERRGGDAFHGYMLPLAALRLKQGFGRLIRSREDRGAVVVLDDRIVRKRYGTYLRDSLPPTPLLKGPWDEVRRRVGAFYG